MKPGFRRRFSERVSDGAERDIRGLVNRPKGWSTRAWAEHTRGQKESRREGVSGLFENFSENLESFINKNKKSFLSEPYAATKSFMWKPDGRHIQGALTESFLKKTRGFQKLKEEAEALGAGVTVIIGSKGTAKGDEVIQVQITASKGLRERLSNGKDLRKPPENTNLPPEDEPKKSTQKKEPSHKSKKTSTSQDSDHAHDAESQKTSSGPYRKPQGFYNFSDRKNGKRHEHTGPRSWSETSTGKGWQAGADVFEEALKRAWERARKTRAQQKRETDQQEAFRDYFHSQRRARRQQTYGAGGFNSSNAGQRERNSRTRNSQEGSASTSAKPEAWWEVLGVELTADEKTVKSAHRKLVQKFHPDKWQQKTEEEKKRVDKKIRQINEAFDTYKNRG